MLVEAEASGYPGALEFLETSDATQPACPAWVGWPELFLLLLGFFVYFCFSLILPKLFHAHGDTYAYTSF